MSILGSFFSKILGHGGAQAAPAPTSGTAAPSPGSAAPPPGTPPASSSTTSSTPATPPSTPGASGSTTAPPSGGSTSSPSGGATAAPSAGTAASAGGSAQPVDVAAILDGLAAKSSQKLDWKHSIVDMMKLLDMDSSLSARQELAKELHYSGDMPDSATMNIWLHKQVMSKLAENGGKVPDDLRN